MIYDINNALIINDNIDVAIAFILNPKLSDLSHKSVFWMTKLISNNLLVGFLTAVLQNHARRLGVSVDALSFDFNVYSSTTDTEDSLRNTKTKLNVVEKGFKVYKKIG